MKKLLLFFAFLIPFISPAQVYWKDLTPSSFAPGDSQTIYRSGAYYKVPAGSGSGGGSVVLAPPATSGVITLSFNTNKVYTNLSQSGNITLGLGTGNVAGTTIELLVSGNGYSFAFPAGWKNPNGDAFDPTMLNAIWIEYRAPGLIIYNIETFPLGTGTDVTPPTYLTQTVTSVTSIAGTFNVKLNEDGLVHFLVTTSSSAPSTAAIDAGTGAVAGNYGSVTVSGNVSATAGLSGLSPSTSYYLWSYSEDAYGNKTSVQSGINFSTGSADVTAPTLVSAVTNTAGSQIILTYSETLASVTPATTDFTLNLGRTVTNVLVTGATVVLTVSSGYVFSDIITDSYTPGANKIQDPSGNFASSFSNQSVTNNSNSATPVTWGNLLNATNDGNGVATATGTGGATATTAVNVTLPFSITIDYLNSSPPVALVCLDENSSTNSYAFGSSPRSILGVYAYSSSLNYTPDNMGTSAAAVATINAPYYVRMAKSGNDLVISTSPDDNVYTSVYTVTGALTGKTTMYLRAMFINGSGTVRVRLNQ